MLPSPPPGLARSSSGANGGWGGGTVTTAAVGVMPPMHAAVPPAEAGRQALSRPPPPGFARDYQTYVARDLPRGGGGGRQPAATTVTATVVESKPDPAATPAGRAGAPPAVNRTAVLSIEPSRGGGGSVGVGGGVGGGGGSTGTQSAQQQSERKFGNCSTKVSIEERSRRNRVLRAQAAPFYPAAHRAQRKMARATPAAFPEESRLPGGGYYMEESPDDILPPPSQYEIQEAARMFRVYDEMMERLRTTGMDETLPNGFTPRIYDFTNGGC